MIEFLIAIVVTLVLVGGIIYLDDITS